MKSAQDIKERIKSYRKDLVKYEQERLELVCISLRYMIQELEWVLSD